MSGNHLLQGCFCSNKDDSNNNPQIPKTKILLTAVAQQRRIKSNKPGTIPTSNNDEDNGNENNKNDNDNNDRLQTLYFGPLGQKGDGPFGGDLLALDGMLLRAPRVASQPRHRPREVVALCRSWRVRVCMCVRICVRVCVRACE